MVDCKLGLHVLRGLFRHAFALNTYISMICIQVTTGQNCMAASPAPGRLNQCNMHAGVAWQVMIGVTDLWIT